MNIVLYTTKDGKAKFNLQAFDEQLWLTQADMAVQKTAEKQLEKAKTGGRKP